MSEDIFRDKLKFASFQYALGKWESILDSKVNLFQFKGEIVSGYSYDEHEGKNVVMLVSELKNESNQVLGQTKTWPTKNAKHIAILRDEQVEGGYCYEEGIKLFLQSRSSELEEKMCRSAASEMRRNFVHVMIHELGHYLGYEPHSSDRHSVMYESMDRGYTSYHFQEVISWFKSVQ
ncbi:MAG: matrixin family metalloprotease [Deltaproteobacteria bacterium]|nr:matrixin family metalloprotease [Deltaproteobacteria bacterium]